MNTIFDSKYIGILATSALVLASCNSGNDDYDATGTFEATEITVSAEQVGKIMQLDITEGMNITEGQTVGLIDTVQLSLKAQQLGATREAFANQRPDVQKQIEAVKQQLAKAQQDEKRFSNLVSKGAANQKQLDDAASQVKVLKGQLDALKSQLSNSTQSLNSQMSATDIQRYQVIDQLQKCYINSPVTGTVLAKYAEAGEFAAVGKPIFKVANLENMYLRAYITSNQLENVKVGQTVTVYADYGRDTKKEYSGTITWISDNAEFTPKSIVTDDERADLVYAIKIAVKNDGGIKIGMYGEMKLQ